MKKQIPITFQSGGKKIQGMLHMPETLTPPLVVGSHGLEGTMDSAKQTILAKVLPPAGIAFLRFDHRGCGQSEGNFLTDTSLNIRVEDMVAATHHALGLGLLDGRVALFGSSLGGSTAVATWHHLETLGIQAKAMVVCAPPLQSHTIENIPLEGNQDRPALPMSFFETNLLFDLTSKIETLKNILIFHGDQDEVVPVKNGYELFRLANKPKKLIIHKNGDHRMSSVRDQKEFTKESLIWYKTRFGL